MSRLLAALDVPGERPLPPTNPLQMRVPARQPNINSPFDTVLKRKRDESEDEQHANKRLTPDPSSEDDHIRPPPPQLLSQVQSPSALPLSSTCLYSAKADDVVYAKPVSAIREPPPSQPSPSQSILYSQYGNLGMRSALTMLDGLPTAASFSLNHDDGAGLSRIDVGGPDQEQKFVFVSIVPPCVTGL